MEKFEVGDTVIVRKTGEIKQIHGFRDGLIVFTELQRMYYIDTEAYLGYELSRYEERDDSEIQTRPAGES